MQQGSAMLEYRPVSPSQLIGRPRCPKCHEPRMLLVKIEAGASGSDYRTFECQTCGRIHTMIISSDPTESGVHGWREGEIEPTP
jgi:RNase P subunit RPR2